MTGTPAEAAPTRASDTAVRLAVYGGFALGLAFPMALRLAAERWESAATWLARVHAAGAGAAVLVLVVVGVLNYLAPTPSVRLMRSLRGVGEEVSDLVVDVRSRLSPDLLATIVLFPVGWAGGSSLVNTWTDWLDGLHEMPDPSPAWPLGGFLVAAALWTSFELWAMRREARRGSAS